MVGFRGGDICCTEEAVFSIRTGKYCSGFFGQLDLPLSSQHADDRQCPSSAQPVFGDFLKVLDPVDDVPLSILLGYVQEVDSAGRMHNVDSNITYLPQAVSSFI